MRPGLVFLSLFLVLMAIYVGLADTLGTGPTFLLQGIIVLVILAAALWVRKHTRKRIKEKEKQVESASQEETATGDEPKA